MSALGLINLNAQLAEAPAAQPVEAGSCCGRIASWMRDNHTLVQYSSRMFALGVILTALFHVHVLIKLAAPLVLSTFAISSIVGGGALAVTFIACVISIKLWHDPTATCRWPLLTLSSLVAGVALATLDLALGYPFTLAIYAISAVAYGGSMLLYIALRTDPPN